MGLSKRRFATVIVATVAVLASATACAKKDSDGGSGSGGDGEKLELTVDLFGDQGFGYDKLYEEYMKAHPNIKITERGRGLGLSDYNTRLIQWMTAGTGAGDVVALEEGTIVQFKTQAANFVNLFDHDTRSLESNFLGWKWKQGQSADGKQLLGLGTDIGSLGMCYRKDLFEKAGLPTDREKVGELWPTWEKFIETGKLYAAKEQNTKFVDAATNIYNTVLMQAAGNGTGYTYFDTSDKLVFETNPDVKRAWDVTVAMINAGLSANLRSFSDGWNTGFKQGQFATIGCPAWMTGVIKGQAGDGAAGKWDVAKAPGEGGNWGGSFLTVPKQSKHQKEAAELAKFLTSPHGQIEAFKQVGALPSSPKALADPIITEAKNEYFNNAPTGQIFGAGAMNIKPVWLGSKNQAVRDEIENGDRKSVV